MPLFSRTVSATLPFKKCQEEARSRSPPLSLVVSTNLLITFSLSVRADTNLLLWIDFVSDLEVQNSRERSCFLFARIVGAALLCSGLMLCLPPSNCTVFVKTLKVKSMMVNPMLNFRSDHLSIHLFSKVTVPEPSIPWLEPRE